MKRKKGGGARTHFKNEPKKQSLPRENNIGMQSTLSVRRSDKLDSGQEVRIESNQEQAAASAHHVCSA